MRPAQPVYLYAQPPPPQQQQHHHQQQQQQQQQQQAHQQQVPLQLNPQFSAVQQQLGGNATFHSPYFSQPAVPNGMAALGLPINGGHVGREGVPVFPGPQHFVLLDPQAGLLRQQWGHLRPESQAWGSGVFPSSHQGMMQSPLLQQRQQLLQQQQAPYFQEVRAPSTVPNGGGLPQLLHGGDGVGIGVGVGRGGVGGGGNFPQWSQPNSKSPFGAPTVSQDNRRPLPEGTRPNEFSSRGIAYGNVAQHSVNGNPYNGRTYDENINGNPYNGRTYDENNHNNSNHRPSPGRWPRGGGAAAAAGAGSSSHNPRFRGGKGDKGRGGESVRAQAQAAPLRCDSCDRTFTNSQQSTAHFSTHVKCDVQACLFEASGRVVKEHRQSVHERVVSEMPVRSKPSKATESEDEVVRWREERKLNYPTAAHIKQKVEETKAKRARGELVDEDARKRRERLKEILAKQAELGVPVAEVPAYYMSDRYGALKGPNVRPEGLGSNQNDSRGKNAKRSRQDRGNASNITNKKGGRGESSASGSSRKDDQQDTAKLCHVQEDGGEGPPTKVARTSDESSELPKPIPSVASNVEVAQTVIGLQQPNLGVKEREESMTGVAETKVGLPEEKNQVSSAARPPPSEKRVCVFFKRGRCKKGNRCQFLHERRPRNKKDVPSAQPVEERAPSLLAKLLNTDIRREKSLLLQSFRFFVNNMFLLDFPHTPLKFFDCQHNGKAEGGVSLEPYNPDIMDLLGQEDDGEDLTGMDLERHDASHDQDGDGIGEVTRSDVEVQGVLLESSEEEELDDGSKDSEKENGVAGERDQTQAPLEEGYSSDCPTE